MTTGLSPVTKNNSSTVPQILGQSPHQSGQVPDERRHALARTVVVSTTFTAVSLWDEDIGCRALQALAGLDPSCWAWDISAVALGLHRVQVLSSLACGTSSFQRPFRTQCWWP